MARYELWLGVWAILLILGCARPVPVRNAHFRSARVRLEGTECVMNGLEKSALPTKLSSVTITRSGNGTYHVKGRYIAIGEERPIEAASIRVANPADKGVCVYFADKELGTTNLKGQFDFRFKPEARQEVFLYKEGYNPQMLKLPFKPKRK